MGAAVHRLRLFWTNMCTSEILQEAVPKNLPPTLSLQTLLHHYHVPSLVGHNDRFLFARCNVVGQPRVAMPTIVSYIGSRAFVRKDDGRHGEGQVYNKVLNCWEEPDCWEKEALLGFERVRQITGM